jgi:hypothetical protein
MTRFWVWGVRNPALALAGLATASGLTGVADWSIALMTVMALGFLAEIANRLARVARARQQREQAAILEFRRAVEARTHYRERAA